MRQPGSLRTTTPRWSEGRAVQLAVLGVALLTASCTTGGPSDDDAAGEPTPAPDAAESTPATGPSGDETSAVPPPAASSDSEEPSSEPSGTEEPSSEVPGSEGLGSEELDAIAGVVTDTAEVELPAGTFDPLRLTVVTETEPGSFGLPIARSASIWRAGVDAELEGLATLAEQDPGWDSRFLDAARDAAPDGSLRAIAAAPVGPDGGIVTWTVHADPLDPELDIETWLREVAPVHLLPPSDQLVGSAPTFDPTGERGSVVYQFTDRISVLNVVADREHSLAWTVTGNVPTDDPDLPVVADVAATVAEFTHDVGAP